MRQMIRLEQTAWLEVQHNCFIPKITIPVLTPVPGSWILLLFFWFLETTRLFPHLWTLSWAIPSAQRKSQLLTPLGLSLAVTSLGQPPRTPSLGWRPLFLALIISWNVHTLFSNTLWTSSGQRLCFLVYFLIPSVSQIIINIYWDLLCAGHYSKHFTLNPHNKFCKVQKHWATY